MALHSHPAGSACNQKPAAANRSPANISPEENCAGFLRDFQRHDRLVNSNGERSGNDRGNPMNVFRSFEVLREKRIVWKWDRHALIKSLTRVRALGE
jgi:hypothetical protein